MTATRLNRKRMRSMKRRRFEHIEDDDTRLKRRIDRRSKQASSARAYARFDDWE